MTSQLRHLPVVSVDYPEVGGRDTGVGRRRGLMGSVHTPEAPLRVVENYREGIHPKGVEDVVSV